MEDGPVILDLPLNRGKSRSHGGAMRVTRCSSCLLFALLVAISFPLDGCGHHKAASTQSSATFPSATPSTRPFSVSPAPSAKASASTIAFVRDDHIWTIDADGSHLRQLTSGSGQDGFWPLWVPGRRAIAFVREDVASDRHEMVLISVGDGAERVLYRDVSQHTINKWTTGLAYSPSGRQIAFADIYDNGSNGRPVCRVLIFNPKTGKAKVVLKRVTGFEKAMVVSWNLSWSPDGKMLLVSQSGQDDTGNETWMLDIGSHSARKLDVADAYWATWSPDGKSILVSTDTQTSSSILLTRPDGNVLRTLAKGGGPGGKPWVGDANFSGNGAMIAYSRSAGNGPRLWLMRADGSGKHVLARGTEPVWR